MSPEELAVSLSLLTLFIMAVFSIALFVISFICWGLIGKKCGFSFWLTSILMLIPVANVIMFLFLGFSKRHCSCKDDKPEEKK